MRKGEALGLRWRDVDLDRGIARISQTVAADKANGGSVLIQPRAKTAAGSRSVRLTDQTVAALKDHRKVQLARRLAASDWSDHDLIVCTGRGTPVNPGGNVNRSFDAIINATRLPDGSPLRRIRVHDLRHTAATLLLAAGVPAKIVSERLGHASISITLDLYSHVTSDMQERAAEAMGAMFAGGVELVGGGNNGN
jgi:integrase